MRPASGRPSAGRIRRTPGRTLTLASRRSASLTSPRSGPGARTSGLRLGGYERANPSGVSAEYWSRRRDLNPRPADYESAALPLSYTGVGVHYKAFTARSPESAGATVVNTVVEFFAMRSIASARW